MNTTTHSTKRFLLSTALAVAALAGGAASAEAGTANKTPGPAATVLYSGSGGDDDLLVTRANGYVTFEDSSGVTAGSACEQQGPTAARCSDADAASISLFLGGGENQVQSTASLPTKYDGVSGERNVIYAGPAENEIIGGPGDDVLDGSLEKDTIEGGGGKDTLVGNGGNDELDGGAADDHLDGGDGADSFTGGSGVDTLSYAGRTGDVKVTYDGEGSLVGNDGEAGEGDRVELGVDNILGGSGDDTFTGVPDPAANGFYGGPGNDRLSGGGAKDVLSGGPGDDLLDGGSDGDIIEGGPDQDALFGRDGADHLVAMDGDDYLAGGADNDVMKGGPGTDEVSYDGASAPVRATLDGLSFNDGAAGEGDSILETEILTGGAGADSLAGNAGPNRIFGGAGADSINPLGGTDTVNGGAGNDSINSRDGAVDQVNCGQDSGTAAADANDALSQCRPPATPGAQPAPTPAPAPAVKAPKLRITPRSLRISRSGVARLRVKCPASAKVRCTGRLRLERGGRRLGSRRFSIRAGRSAIVRVKVSRGTRRLVASKRRVAIRAVAVARDAASPNGTSRLRVVVRNPRR